MLHHTGQCSSDLDDSIKEDIDHLKSGSYTIDDLWAEVCERCDEAYEEGRESVDWDEVSSRFEEEIQWMMETQCEYCDRMDCSYCDNYCDEDHDEIRKEAYQKGYEDAMKQFASVDEQIEESDDLFDVYQYKGRGAPLVGYTVVDVERINRETEKEKAVELFDLYRGEMP